MEPILGVHEKQMETTFRMKEKQTEPNSDSAEKNAVPAKPVLDEFVREEHIPAGLYRREKDEICRGSTDKVDREIEKLKRKKEELEASLNTETDETRKKELESKLAQVERELRQKDNDAYRRQRSVFS